MTLLQNSYGECSLSVIHQSEWLSLDRLCYFPSETTHEKVLGLALVCLVEKEWRHNSVFWSSHSFAFSPSQRLWRSWCQCSDREADPSGSSDTCQALNDSSPGRAGLLVPRCYRSFPWAFWLTSLSTLEHLPTQPLLPPAILSMSYRLCFFWTREAPASAHVHACSRPEFFTALVYRRVGNTAFLCPHGSFMCSLISSAGLNEGIGRMLKVDQYLPIYLFLWVSAYGVYVGTASYMRWYAGSEHKTFERGFSPSPCSLREGPLCWFGPCGKSSTQLVCELLDDSPVCCPPSHWSMGIIGAHLWSQGLDSSHQTSLPIPLPTEPFHALVLPVYV